MPPSLRTLGNAEVTEMTVNEARALVEDYLKTKFPTQELAIRDQHTIEFDGGWMFFYNSAAFARTGDRQYTLFGNAPLIVSDTGRITVTGTRYPGRDFVEAYRALGPDRFEKREWEEWIAESADAVQMQTDDVARGRVDRARCAAETRVTAQTEASRDDDLASG